MGRREWGERMYWVWEVGVWGEGWVELLKEEEVGFNFGTLLRLL